MTAHTITSGPRKGLLKAGLERSRRIEDGYSLDVKIPGLQLKGSLDELPWRSTRDEGIHWIDLRTVELGQGAPEAGMPAHWDDREADPSMTVLIRMEPGRGYPRHRHLGAEDVLVLAGGYGDDDGRVFRAGEFVRYPAGSEHTPVALGVAGEPIGADNPACVLFAVAHGGTELTQPIDPSARGGRSHSSSELLS